MHAIEKIFAKNAGKASVETGEIVMAKVDFAEINDLYLQTVYSFYEMGGEKVWDNTPLRFLSLTTMHPAPPLKVHRTIRKCGNSLKRTT